MPYRILVIEDEQDTREIARIILSLNGYEVLEASSSAEGYQKAVLEKPDAILMDISLSAEDGFELAKRLKNTENTRAIPLIAYTAHSGEDKIQKILDAGCAGYVLKPCSPEAIVREVSRVLPGLRDA